MGKPVKDRPERISKVISLDRGNTSHREVTVKDSETATLAKITGTEQPAKPATSLKLTIDSLKTALHKGNLPMALYELKKYVDPVKLYEDGFNSGKKDVDTRSVEYNGNTEVMRSRMEAATETADASLSAIMDTAIYSDQHNTVGGLKDTITETGFMWGVVTALKDLIAQTRRAEEEKKRPGDQPTSVDEPEVAAEKFFEMQKKLYAAKYGEMTWNRTMISDSDIELNKAKDDYQRRFWTKVHQLALGIKSDVDDSTRKRKETKESGVYISAWWLLLPVGIGGAALGIRYFFF